MKKLLSTLLALSLALSLGACAVKVDPNGPDAPKPSQPETPELTFTEERRSPMNRPTRPTTARCCIENYELPQLEVRTADGGSYEPGAATRRSTAVAVRDAFNAEMERAADAVDASNAGGAGSGGARPLRQ